MKNNAEYRSWLYKQGVKRIHTKMSVEPNEKVYLFKGLAMARTFENTYFKAVAQPSKIEESNDRFGGFHKLAINSEQEATLKKALEDLHVNQSKVVIYSAAVEAGEGCKVALKFNDPITQCAFIKGFTNIMGEDEMSTILDCSGGSLVYIRNTDKALDYGSVEYNGNLAINCGMPTAANSLVYMLSLTNDVMEVRGNLIVFNPDRLPLVADKKSNIVANFQEPVDNRCVEILRNSYEKYDSAKLLSFLTFHINEHAHAKIGVLACKSLKALCGMMHGGDERESYTYSIELSNVIREYVGDSFTDFVVHAEQSLGK